MPVPQERLTSVTYQGVATQTRYTFHFDYLNKKFVKVLLTDSLYGTEQELTQNIDYTVYQKEITLNTPTNKIIKIYRKTDTLPTVSWEEGSVLRATDLTLQDTQVYHLIEESVEGNKTNSEMLNDAIHLVNDAMTSASTATTKATEASNSASQAAISATIATNATTVCESLSTHAILPTNAHTATAISTTATGTIPAGTVQSAIASLETNKVSTSDVVNTPTANKILKLNSAGKLPCDITGNAATVSAVAWAGITGKPTTFTPPIATASVLGGVKVGSGLSVGGDGTITVPPTTIKYIKIQDEKPSGTGGGTFTSGAWRTRDLNTIVTDDTGQVVLSNNRFTLPVGKYEITAITPANRVNENKARLYNVTDGTSVYSDNQYANYNVMVHSLATVMAVLTIATPKVFEIQHYASGTFNTTGFGIATSIPGVNEVYTQIIIRKVG